MFKRLARAVLILIGLLLVVDDVASAFMPDPSIAVSSWADDDEPGDPIDDDASLPAALVNDDRDDDELVLEAEDESCLAIRRSARRESDVLNADQDFLRRPCIQPSVGHFDVRLRPPRV